MVRAVRLARLVVMWAMAVVVMEHVVLRDKCRTYGAYYGRTVALREAAAAVGPTLLLRQGTALFKPHLTHACCASPSLRSRRRLAWRASGAAS